MGEATYYAILRFEDAKAAEEAEPKIVAFLKRLAECENRWQAVRDLKIDAKTGEVDQEHWREAHREGGKKAFEMLKQEFPEVFELMEIKPPDKEQEYESLNFLAGVIDSPATAESTFQLEREEDEIRFEGLVWHFADWDPLMVAMRKFGAVSVGWQSDEFMPQSPYEFVAERME